MPKVFGSALNLVSVKTTGVHGKSTAPFLSCLAKKVVDMSSDTVIQRQWFHQCLSLATLRLRGNTASLFAGVQV